jgi:hypothetical protein
MWIQPPGPALRLPGSHTDEIHSDRPIDTYCTLVCSTARSILPCSAPFPLDSPGNFKASAAVRRLHIVVFYLLLLVYMKSATSEQLIKYVNIA